MKAVRIYEHGGVDKLIYDDISEPNCPADKIKVKIKATAINHLDIWVRKGLPNSSVKLPMILGSDGSGTIVEIGNRIHQYHIGNDVIIQPGTFCQQCRQCQIGQENYCLEYGVLGESEDGTQAEYIIVDPINIYDKPKHLSHEEASSMPLVFMTAYQMLIKRAKLESNETVLIYGGTSGVGSAAIQISRALGAQVIATAGSDEKCQYIENMGTKHVVNHSRKHWLEKVKSITGKNGVNVVFEHIGSATWIKSQRILAKGGRVVTCGATTGSEVNINLEHLFIKQHSILGSTMSSIAIFQEVMDKCIKNEFKPMVDRVFMMEDVRNAHKYIENRQQMGKVVVIPR